MNKINLLWQIHWKYAKQCILIPSVARSWSHLVVCVKKFLKTFENIRVRPTRSIVVSCALLAKCISTPWRTSFGWRRLWLLRRRRLPRRNGRFFKLIFPHILCFMWPFILRVRHCLLLLLLLFLTLTTNTPSLFWWWWPARPPTPGELVSVCHVSMCESIKYLYG